MSFPPPPPTSANPWFAELRACAALSWPLVLTNAIEMLMNLTNAAVIARLSPRALAASTLGLALYNLFLLFGIGVIAAVASLIAHARGRGGDPLPAIRRIAQQAIWGAVLVTGPIWVALWNAAPILRALGQEPALAAEAAAYLHVLQWAVLPAFVYLVLRSLIAALERPRWAVATGIAGVALNAVLNLALVHGIGGAPRLGLQGSALATLLANLCMAGALGTIAVVHPRFRELRLLSGLARPGWDGFGRLWRLGLPIGVSLVLETGMFSAAAALVGLIDAASLAAHAIAIQVASITFMVPLGIAQAATVRIARATGGGDGPAAARAGWTALTLGLGAMACSATLLITAPHAVMGLFLDPAEPGAGAVEAVGVVLLGIAGLFQLADGAQVVLAGMLRGLQDTRAPMIVAAVGYWGIGLPLGAALAFRMGLGAAGVWLGLTAGLFAVAALLLLRWTQWLRRPRPRPRTA